MPSTKSLLDGWAEGRGDKSPPHNGVFALVIINLVFYAADHLLGLGFMRSLYLPLDGPHWYQYLTSMFCHGSWMHLSGNLVFLYLFGKLVEEHEGSLGVWVS